jgi:cysteine synthase A
MPPTTQHSAVAPSVLDAIGHTPAITLRSVVPPDAAGVLVKLEFYNPTGSYKDRMALAVIDGAARRPATRHARGRVRRRQHGIIARDGVRGPRVPLHAPVVGRFRRGEAADLAPVRRGTAPRSERRRPGDADAVQAVPHRDRGTRRRAADVLDGSAQQHGCRSTATPGSAGSRSIRLAAGSTFSAARSARVARLSGVARALHKGMADRRPRIVALEPASLAAMTAWRAGPGLTDRRVSAAA